MRKKIFFALILLLLVTLALQMVALPVMAKGSTVAFEGSTIISTVFVPGDNERVVAVIESQMMTILVMFATGLTAVCTITELIDENKIVNIMRRLRIYGAPGPPNPFACFFSLGRALKVVVSFDFVNNHMKSDDTTGTDDMAKSNGVRVPSLGVMRSLT